MSDISLPNGMGVAIGTILTLLLAAAGLLVALIAAAVAATKKEVTRPARMRHVARFAAGPLACAACGALYAGLAGVAGERTLGLLDEACFDVVAIAASVGATVAIAVHTRASALAAPPGTSRRPWVVATVVSAGLGVGIAAVTAAAKIAEDAHFGPSGRLTASGLALFAVLAMTVAERSVRRAGRHGERPDARLVLGLAGLPASVVAWFAVAPALASHRWSRGAAFDLSVTATHDRQSVAGTVARLVLTYKPTRHIPWITDRAPDTIEEERAAAFESGGFTFREVETDRPSWAAYRLDHIELRMPGAAYDAASLCNRRLTFPMVAERAVAQGEHWGATGDGTGVARAWGYAPDGHLKVVLHCAQTGTGAPLPTSARRVEISIDASRYVIPVVQNTQDPPWTWAGTLGALDADDGARLGADDLELSPGTRVRLKWYPEKYYSPADAPVSYNVHGLVRRPAAIDPLVRATVSVPRSWSSMAGGVDRRAWEAVREAEAYDAPIDVELEDGAVTLAVRAATDDDLVLVLAADMDGEPIVGFSMHRVTVRTETRDRVRRLTALRGATSRDADRERVELLGALQPSK